MSQLADNPHGERQASACRFPVTTVRDGAAAAGHRLLAVEAPLAFRVETRPLATLMRTPGDDASLARGFLLTEGLIASPDEVRRIDVGRATATRPPGTVDVWLTDPEQAQQWQDRYRRVYSSCGLCGAVAIEDVAGGMPPLPRLADAIPPSRLSAMAETLRSHQTVFDRTGGTHGVALFEADGTLLAIGEDIGRHNAVDKVVGQVTGAGGSPGGKCLVVSGRLSYEIVTKAARVGIPLVAGVSAPTDLGVQLARSIGMILVGFLRGSEMTVYSGHEGFVPG